MEIVLVKKNLSMKIKIDGDRLQVLKYDMVILCIFSVFVVMSSF